MNPRPTNQPDRDVQILNIKKGEIDSINIHEKVTSQMKFNEILAWFKNFEVGSEKGATCPDTKQRLLGHTWRIDSHKIKDQTVGISP